MSGSYFARVGLAGFACGVILLYRLTVLPPSFWLTVLAVVAMGPALISGSRRRIAYTVIASLLLGLAWSAWQAQSRLQAVLPAELEGRALEVSGTVCSVPETGSYDSVRFSFCARQWHMQDPSIVSDALPERLRLAWYGDQATLDLPATLRLTVVLKRPHGGVNPEGFRYESWLFRHGFGATGTIRSARADLSVSCGIVCQYHAYRGALVEETAQRLSGADSLPLAMSLMLGYRGYLDPGHWATLKATGTIHLVAISGLHLGLVAMGVGLVARRLLVWIPERRLSPGKSRLLLFVLVCFASTAYALAAGFSVPTRRALVMVVAGCWWLLNARRVGISGGILVALFAVLVLDPFSPLDQGFWLSFGAVACLLVVLGGRVRPTTWLRGLVLAQFAVFAGLWPILSVLGQQQPLVGFFANLIAIPWVSLVVMPLLLVSSLVMLVTPALDGFVISGIDVVLGGLLTFLGWAGGLALPELRAGFFELAVFAGLILLALAFPARGFRYFTGLTVLGWMIGHSFVVGRGVAINPAVPYPEMWLWDVGQGLSVMVRDGNDVLVYDTGPALEGVFSAAESVLVPNLSALGVQRIDTLVISHGDSDHAGGLSVLADRFAVGRVITGEPERLKGMWPADSAIEIEACKGSIESGSQDNSIWQAEGDPGGNDASCVVMLRFHDAQQEIILSGDITAKTESAFLNHWRMKMPHPQQDSYRVVLAPHHGSNTSSSEEWASGLGADLVLFSAGYRHRYGHPHPDVVARYQAQGSEMLNTATSGAIRLVFRPDGVRMSRERLNSPFWIWNPVTSY